MKLSTKNVLETALNEELTKYLGHEKNRADPDRGSGNVRNGTRPKTVLTEATGQITIEVPRDRDGSFEPKIVRKRQRRLNGVEEIVLSRTNTFAYVIGADTHETTHARRARRAYRREDRQGLRKRNPLG